MKSAASTETQTQTVKGEGLDPVEKSWWSEFCLKYGINSNLVMLKVTLFVMHGGR